jgi:hypothetical protein
MTDERRLPITPQMKVAELLDAYPELEPVLVGMASPFEKLKNPVMRRTIARVTSLEKAAAVAGLPVRELIAELRRATGQPAEQRGDAASSEAPARSTSGRPDWADPSRLAWTVEADALLESGREPLQEVQRRARTLRNGEQGLIRSSFRPEPLVELLSKQRYRVAVVATEEGFETFVEPSGG